MDFGCIICHDSFSTGGPCVVTKCGHVFHSICVAEWIDYNRSCPSCRAYRTRADLFRIYLATVTDSNLASALHSADMRINSLQNENADLMKDNKQLNAKQKMIENNKNQKIR